MQRRIADIKKDIAAHSARSAWDKGVKGYAVELFDDYLDRRHIQTSLDTKNPQTMRFSQGLGTRILAGAEGLEPSARGFGVDVGERTREREKADVIRFPPQAPERPVLVWCCELFLEKDCVSTTTSSFERKAPPPGGWPS